MYCCVTSGITATPSGLHNSRHNLQFYVQETTSVSTDNVIGPVECANSDTPTPVFAIADDVPFELVQVGQSNIARLLRTAELDYDTGPSFYQFIVTCSDTTGNVTGNITVTILPENDNLPEVKIMPTSITIHETTPLGTVLASQGSDGIAQIIASDEDRGEDGVLNFHFNPTTDDDFTAHFTINQTDGTITLKVPFDVDIGSTPPLQELFIKVCDGNRTLLLCPVLLLDIIIQSVNEFDPQFSQSLYNTTEAVYSEGVYSELVIATVECTDADVQQGEFESIQLHSPVIDPLVLVKLQNGQVSVVLNGTLDYELVGQDEVQVQILCSDNGQPPRQDIATIILNIKGLDDNLPVLSKDMYTASLPETYAVNTWILTVTCSDADIGVGARAGLEILSTDSDVTNTFRIDADSGNITLIQSLDYDQGYEFKVRCTDSVGNEAIADVNITVVGVNDEPVRFNKTEYRFTVDRLEWPGTVVGQLEVKDEDVGQQEPITYSIEDNANFDIDSDGQIVLQGFIFHLEGDHFTFNVTAGDGANNDATTRVVVSVEGPLSVLDIIIIIGALLVILITTAVVVGCICCLCKRR